MVATAAAPMRAASLSAQFSRGVATFSGLGKGKEVAVVGAPATAVGETAASAATGGTRAGLRSG